MTVLDASAILGLILGEPRARSVLDHLDGAAVSAVNHAEVVGKLTSVGMPSPIVVEAVDRLDLDIVSFTEVHAVITGELRSLTSAMGLSIGDRACLGTALDMGATVVTLDRAWADLDLGIPIIVLT
ncbi:MAG TPA: type II toxin-antitoxin system VapC family toxin [Acidimicrobiia bacterium]|nr:type II toxin-antitoxin system VapC family toxin [Acidimicrobiia bacterium]